MTWTVKLAGGRVTLRVVCVEAVKNIESLERGEDFSELRLPANVTRYLEGGNDQLAIYRDHSRPTFVARELRTRRTPSSHRDALRQPLLLDRAGTAGARA
jgi:hypothetical protein